MLISLKDLVTKYGINFKGILHIGAHECEELNDYENYLPRDKIVWVEALTDKVILCRNKYPNIIIEEAVISDKEETVTFHRSNNGQSSSILEFGLHKVFHPSISYVDSYNKNTILLQKIVDKYNHIPFNFVNLDIQGMELRALKSMETYLPNVDYIFTEVNSDYVYKDCALIGEIDEYLSKFNFVRVETCWCNDFRWGDAFYIKSS